MRSAVHSEFERKSGQALDFFGCVARPLSDQFDDGRREIGVGVDRHLAEGPSAGDHHENGDHEDEKALTKREMYDAMDHRWLPWLPWCLVLQRIHELQKEAAVSGDTFAFFEAGLDLDAAFGGIAESDLAASEFGVVGLHVDERLVFSVAEN